MLFSQTTFIGIDPTAGERPFSYAALDNELNLLALNVGNMEEVLAFCAGQQRAVVAACAPRRLNQGLMADPEVRGNLSPSPRVGRWENFRTVDFMLRQHNINIPMTPRNEEDCPNWMRVGFVLYRRLEELGYTPYSDETAERQYIEVYPHASYTILLEVLPFSKYSLEGRLQRQLALFERGIKITDPMQFFEEITRYRLIHGILPFETLHSTGELDALIAAYTAWLTSTRPDQITFLGDPEEGQVALPTKKLKSKYSKQ